MIIQYGNPDVIGRYVGYFGDQVGIMKWTGKQWEYSIMGGNFPHHVKGWLGPLPAYGVPVQEYDL